MTKRCSFVDAAGSHVVLKDSAALWDAHTVPPNGHEFQPIQYDGEEMIQYGNCCECNSTIVRELVFFPKSTAADVKAAA